MASMSRVWKGHILLILPLFVAACASSHSPSQVNAPGAAASTKTTVLEAGAALLQGNAPVDALNIYLDGFHFYNGQMEAQVEAHHFCSVINEEMNQCVIFDGNTKDAKIMGVEYIISKQLFETLSPDEKAMWHSHVHEVKSGQLVAPRIPQKAEYALMEKIIGTYGKTWHTWHTDKKQALPLGHPFLMMGFTADGQVQTGLVELRDQRFKIQSEDKRKDRANIVAPAIAPGADAWQQGHILQLWLQKSPSSVKE
jgi:hypothetical protein